MNIYYVKSHFHTQTMKYLHHFLVVANDKKEAEKTFENDKFKLPPNAQVTKLDKRKSFYYEGSLYKAYEYLKGNEHPHIINAEFNYEE